MRLDLAADQKSNAASLILLIALFLSACATPYQRADPKWGFFEKQLDETHYLVGFKADGFTEHSKIVAYFMYRCAELTQQAGHDYFIIEDPKSFSEEPVDPSRIQLILVPGGPSLVTGIVSIHKGSPPPQDPYAFDSGALQIALEGFIR